LAETSSTFSRPSLKRAAIIQFSEKSAAKSSKLVYDICGGKIIRNMSTDLTIACASLLVIKRYSASGGDLLIEEHYSRK